MPVLPYLEGRPRQLFDAWHAAAQERFARNLTFREIRKGAQALSVLYVERHGRVPPGKPLDGHGKRAAFVLYYGALHYLAVHHVVRRTGLSGRSLRRLVDLGCGAGTSGAAWAGLLPNKPLLMGIDRSGWALQEAVSTYAAFGLPHETHRRDLLEQELPGEGEGVLLAWSVSELHETSRRLLLARIDAAIERGLTLLVVEPVARDAAPWWGEWTAALAHHDLGVDEVRVSLQLPPWLAHMDKAAGLRHGTMTVRALHTRVVTSA